LAGKKRQSRANALTWWFQGEGSQKPVAELGNGCGGGQCGNGRFGQKKKGGVRGYEGEGGTRVENDSCCRVIIRPLRIQKWGKRGGGKQNGGEFGEKVIDLRYGACTRGGRKKTG